MNLNSVLKRSKENIEKEWSWLFKGIPMKHRIKVVSDGGLHWLQVDFVNHHKKSVSSQKYLIQDMIMHAEDYVKAVNEQWREATSRSSQKTVKPSESKPAFKDFKKAKKAFEDDLNDFMFSVVNNALLDQLCRKHFGTPDVVESIDITNETKVNFKK